jgi:amino acid adenylation domain-containing protein
MEENLSQQYTTSVQQRRAWAVEKYINSALNNSLVIQIEGNLNSSVLKEALNKVFRQNEIFRTNLYPVPSLKYPVQILSENHHDFGEDILSPETGTHPLSTEKQFLPAPGEMAMIKLMQLSPVKYYLKLSLPALQSDTGTLNKIFNDIANTYQSLNEGRELESIAESLQYIDFSEWQKELLEENVSQGTIKYWDKIFNPEELSEDLIFEKHKCDNTVFKWDSFQLNEDSALGGKLKMISEKYAVNSSSILVFCWYHLLKRYKENLTIGYATEYRSDNQLENVAGLFERFLPLKLDYTNDDKIDEVIKQIDQLRNQGHEFQEYFNALDKGHGEVTYFPCCFQFAAFSRTVIQDNLKWSIYQNDVCTDLFKLKLSCNIIEDEKLELIIKYDQCSFDKETISNLASGLKSIIASVVNSSNKTLSSISIGKEEEDLLLDTFNQQGTDKSALTFTELFEAQAKETPEQPAIIFQKNTWTYAKTNDAANQFASLLMNKYGISPSDKIAIQASRSDKLIIALLGIVKSAAAYIPIDIYWPEERVKYIAEDSNAVLLITESENLYNNLAVKVVSLRSCFDDLEQESKNNKKTGVVSSDSIYCIYTSGTTGTPKGVSISHASLVNYLLWFNQQYDIRPTDSTLLISSIAFDLPYTALWSSLTSGATLFVSDESKIMDVQAVNDLLINHDITYLKLTPSHFRMLLSEDSFAENVKNYSLRLIVLGGEEIITNDLDIYIAHNKNITFVNHYGPTESTIGTAAYTVTASNFADFKINKSIGKPISNNQILILNSDDRLVALGEVGEICVSGIGLASGYINKDDLTREKFIELSFRNFAKHRFYKTGDLGRWLPNGLIDFKGRTDFQVKVRGYRIELGEIENVLLKHKHIKQALVLAKEDKAGEKRLIAYIISDDTNHKDLRQYLKLFLPEYMVPETFVDLDSFPLTPHGKIDRKLLPEPKASSANNLDFILPKNEIEQQLVNIWKEVLGKNSISVSDNFFEIGGYSLKATQILSRIAKDLQVKISLKTLFTSTTIESLAREIAAASPVSYNQIKAIAKQPYYDVSHGQKRLWIMNQIEKKSVSYNIPKAYIFNGPLNREILEKCFRTLVERHESLRTIFITVDGVPKQYIRDPDSCIFNLEYMDISSAHENSKQAGNILKEEASKPFDLEKGPLIRAKLLQLNEEKFVFIFTMHHIISDAISKEILIKEITLLYDVYSKNKPNPLPPLRIQYKDYTSWEHEQLSGKRLEIHRDFWLNQFSGNLPSLQLPLDYKRSPKKTNNGKIVNFFLDKDLRTAIKSLCQEKEVTLFMMLLASLKVLLYRYTGQEDIIIGTPVSGRNHGDLENQIGLYLNSLPLRTQFKGNDTFEELLLKITKNTFDAFEHQLYPFDKLIEDLNLNRDISRSPLFDVVLVFNSDQENEEQSDRKLDSVVVNNVDTGFRTSNVDIRFVFFEKEEKIIGYIDYNPDLFKAETINTMAERLTEIFRVIAIAPDTIISAINVSGNSPGTNIQAQPVEETFNFDFS